MSYFVVHRESTKGPCDAGIMQPELLGYVHVHTYKNDSDDPRWVIE